MDCSVFATKLLSWKILPMREALMRSVSMVIFMLDRAEEKLRQTYGSRDYNALDAEMRKTFVKVISQDLADCLPKVQSPTLLVWGDGDTETPLWMGQKMEREIPDAALVVLEGGTHFAYLEQADRFFCFGRVQLADLTCFFQRIFICTLQQQLCAGFICFSIDLIRAKQSNVQIILIWIGKSFCG